MRYFQNLINVFYILFILLSIPACKANDINDTEHLLQDADAFCKIHEVDNWKDLKRDMSISEFNVQVKATIKSVLKTKEFLTLLDDMENVEFYREMYPTAKEKIESLTGSTWDCPAYQNFYKLKSQPDNPKQWNSLEPQIVVNSSDQYFLQDHPLYLSTNDLERFITLRTKDQIDSPIIILLKNGANDLALQELLKALSSLKVSNVRVISEE